MLREREKQNKQKNSALVNIRQKKTVMLASARGLSFFSIEDL